MYRLLFCIGVGFVLLASAGRAAAQGEKPKGKDTYKEALQKLLAKAEDEYRNFFQKPTTVFEYWAAMQFEVEVGKFDVAALHLDQMLKNIPPEKADPELLKIEAAEGLSRFVRLQNVRKWNDHPQLQKEAEQNVKTLIDRITTALEKQLGDPVRINKFIDNLSAATPEERAYAFVQLDRSKERAGPFLVDALRQTAGTIKQRRIIEAMVKLDRGILPPTFEALHARDAKDAKDVDLRMALLEVIKRRLDKRAIPYLWNLSASPKYPGQVRAEAAKTLAVLLETSPEFLPPAKAALTQLAEDLYQHKTTFPDPRKIRVWEWTKDYRIDPKPVDLRAAEYEQIFGTRYAKQALELDPAYRPAQVVYLSLTLERYYLDKLDQILLGKTSPSLDRLLATVDPDLLLDVLNRALREHNPAVILPTVKALGERGVVRAARPGQNGVPGPLVRALSYPDRRVQLAAVAALVRIPADASPAASLRVVDILRRTLAAEPGPRALLVAVPGDQAAEIRKLFQVAGFDPVLVANRKEAFERIRKAADIDVVVVGPAFPESELPFLVSELRADGDVGLLPLLLIPPPKQEARLARIAERHRNVAVLPEAALRAPGELKKRLEDAIKLAAAPDPVVTAPERQRDWLVEDVIKRKGQAFSEAERKQLAAEAMDTLWKMARGQIKGFDARAAEPAVVEALNNPDLAVPAMEILGHFPGATTQQRLAELVLDAKRGKQRVTAALALNRHVQHHGLALNANQVKLLAALSQDDAEDPNLRGQLAILMGSLRTTAGQTGDLLQRFERRDPPPKK